MSQHDAQLANGTRAIYIYLYICASTAIPHIIFRTLIYTHCLSLDFIRAAIEKLNIVVRCTYTCVEYTKIILVQDIFR